MSAAPLQPTIIKLGNRAARGVAGFLQFALPIAMFVHVGFFTRMTNIAEALGVLLACGAFACFSWFAAFLLRLTETS